MVVMIVIILSVLAMPQFSKTKEHALTKEAQANLKLIAAAQKIYRMEAGAYYPIPAGSKNDVSGTDCATEKTINPCLRLSLTETNWDYAVTGAASTFTATAQRKSGIYSSCQYSINQSQDDPVASGTCP